MTADSRVQTTMKKPNKQQRTPHNSKTAYVMNGSAQGQFSDSLAAEKQALLELDPKLLVARDRIRQVARGESTGFYWHGRPGTGKTHTVIATLEEMGVQFHYHKGYLTAQGLLELMATHRTSIIILDDVSAIFDDKKAVQYLLAALGRINGTALPLSYKRQGQEIRFEFTGGIICISNLAIENKGMLAAFKSRVRTLQHSPSDLMLVALCRHRICHKGWPTAKPELTAAETNEVIEWVRKESTRFKVPVDLRVILEKAMPDYLAWRNKKTEAHWHDLVTTTLEEEVTTLAYTPPGGINRVGVRQSTKEQEQQIVRAILQEYSTRQDRIWAWKERTRSLGKEKSEKAFERRWAEVKVQDITANVSEVSETSEDS
jgi:hypothetical protein